MGIPELLLLLLCLLVEHMEGSCSYKKNEREKPEAPSVCGRKERPICRHEKRELIKDVQHQSHSELEMF